MEKEMKTKHRINGYIIRSAAYAVFFLFALIALSLAVNSPNGWHKPGQLTAVYDRTAKIAVQARALTFAERVSYQRAIEDVYWRHRIWPKERPEPKPALDEVMPAEQLEKKVEDYLFKSEALEDYWQQPISADQLQTEMERMAQHTKQPEVLRELFEALGNDPFVIAECLARPALSERLLTNFYSHDQRFHGELKQRAEAELQTHHNVKQMKRTSGHYSEIELVRSDSAQDQETRGPANGLKMKSPEWDENVQKLAAMFATANPPGGGFSDAHAVAAGVSPAKAAPITKIKTGVSSPLQEDEDRYYATAVLKESKDRLKLATVEWRKEPLESWRARVENQMPKVMAAATANYTVPTISNGASGCTNDTWTTTSAIIEPPRRIFHTAVWTGSEMVVWGGEDDSGYSSNIGWRYNPSTDSWAATSSTNAPSGRILHTAVWTGTEMIVWGGVGFTNTGGRYNPGTDSWTSTSTTNEHYQRALRTILSHGSVERQ
jgi:hypothetical protein